MPDRPVYSTARGDLRAQDADKTAGYVKSAGPAKMRLETAGRGGKAVTVLFNLPLTEDDARGLMKELQGQLGIGATLKEGRLEFRGDQRDKIEAHCAKRGLKVVRAGG